ncbi:hypothetical protein AMATHDRAFT_102661, partial [Amanita thiersii Skay4041]
HIWHKHLGHPGAEALRHFKNDTLDMPSNVVKPRTDSICTGCVKGKMTNKSFPSSESRAKQPFELVHSDVKEFPKEGFRRTKYIVTFLDDFS